MADRCLCHAYFEGVYDKQIKQGQDFDLAQGVRAIDGYGNEVDFTYEPTEIDLCKTGDQEVTYKAFGASFNVVPKLCMPKYKKGVSIPEACPSDLEMITAKRIIRIIRASNPRFLGIPRVTITENEAFDPTEGVMAVDDNGNTIDFSYEGKYDLVAEGDGIATFETEYEQNAKAVEVALEPIQDLNGYDKPWSGGAGKNKFDKEYLSNFANYTITIGSYKYTDKIQLKPNTNYVITATNKTAMSSALYYVLYHVNGSDPDKIAPGASEFLYPVYDGRVSQNVNYTNFTTGETGVIRFGVANATALAEIMSTDWQLEEGDTATSWTPYSNICPISGHTECVTEVCGVNVWDEEWEVGGINSSNGQDLATMSQIRSKGFISILPSTAYFNYFGNIEGGGNFQARFYDSDKEYIGYVDADGVAINKNRVFVTPSNARYMRFQVQSTYGTTYNHDISINYPSTDTDYHAYDGDTYTTTLGRTVYGGTLDVVSGELVVDRAMVDLGTLDWQEGVVPGRPITFYTNSLVYNRQNPNALCSHYQVVSSGTIDGTIRLNNNGRISVIDSRHTTLEDFKNAVNGVQLCYELATPTTIQLTPQQVELLKGTNNVWSEEGGVRVIYEGNIPQDGSFEYPLEGEYTITYKATDKCGNEGTAERTIVVTPSE